MNIQNAVWVPRSTGWVFSPSRDVWLFVVPGLLGLLLVFLLGYFDLLSNPFLTIGGTKVFLRMAWFEWFALALLDAPHVLATGYRIYSDPVELKKNRALYVGMPILVMGGLFGLFSFSEMWAFRFVSYFNIYHIIKQQVGMVSYSQVKSNLEFKINRRILKLMTYNFTLVPILLWHFSPYSPRSGWIFDEDMLLYSSEFLYTALLAVHWALNLFFAGVLFNQVRKGHPLAAGQLLQLGVTWLAWYGGIVLRFDGESTLLLDILHIAPYLGLTFFVYKSQSSQRQSLRFAKFYIPLALIGLSLSLVYSLYTTRNAGFFGILALAVILGINVSHYILDGYIWKLGQKNPTVQNWIVKAE